MCMRGGRIVYRTQFLDQDVLCLHHNSQTQPCPDSLVSGLQTVCSINDVWAVLADFAMGLGIEFVSYASARSDAKVGTSTWLSNFPDWWTKLYYADETLGEDAIFIGDNRVGPTLFQTDVSNSYLKLNAKVAERLVSMGEFGLRSGFVCPTEPENSITAAGWCFGSSLGQTDFIRLYANHGATLRLASLCAHQQIEAFKRSSESRQTANCILSDREQECLLHLASGYRSSGIAYKMGITLSTVEFHLRRIRKKLGAATREEAVAKAVALGHISFPTQAESSLRPQ
ncbi:MAG: LuxR C-terminal-related transcriptional regulator [Pseudomonadota bacterium]